MRIGVICEGPADRAVISNIIFGLTHFDGSNIVPLRPVEYTKDATDMAHRDKSQFGNWSIVKEECESRELIDEFLSIESQDFVVIHIDTAEASEYGVKRPLRTANYCKHMRSLVIDQINSWLKDEMSDQILYAVAVEEIDAWILPIYDPRDSSGSADPKKKLGRALRKAGKNSISNYKNYLSISAPLSKAKQIREGSLLDYNCSLSAFYEEVKAKVLPKLV